MGVITYFLSVWDRCFSLGTRSLVKLNDSYTLFSVSGFVDEHMYFVDGNDAVTTPLFKNKKKKTIANYSLANNCCGFLFLYLIKT